MKKSNLILVFFCLLFIFSCTQKRQNSNSGTTSSQKKKAPADRGKILYMQYCLNCHQVNGEGIEGLYPPLVETEWTSGNKDLLIEIILIGQQGPLEVVINDQRE